MLKRRPRMVFSGEFWAGASGAGLVDGFRTLGWSVQEVDSRHYFPQAGGKLALRITSRLTRKQSLKLFCQRLLDECEAVQPDVFMTIKGIGVSRAVLEKIRAAGTKTVMFYPDVHFNHGGVSTDSFDGYDHFVTTKSFQMPWLEARLPAGRAAYVPHGYSFLTHVPTCLEVGENDYRFDVLYAGSHSPYKQQWLENLVPLGGDLDIAIAGSRWNDVNFHRDFSKIKMLGILENVSYAEAIQRSRINIALHFGPVENGWQDLVSTRTFEIPACNGFMLHIDSDEVREFFMPGKEIDVFSSPEELKDKIAFYLSHPELREKMKSRAHERCKIEHSYRNRAAAIARLLVDGTLPVSTASLDDMEGS